jgi:hypothetical protein
MKQTLVFYLELFLACVSPALGQATLTWDANISTSGAQDGAGTWNTSNTNCWTGTAITSALDHSLRDLSVDGESICMAFSSEAGKSYRLWKNPSLAPSDSIPVRTSRALVRAWKFSKFWILASSAAFSALNASIEANHI